jgi:hypothetical protein
MTALPKSALKHHDRTTISFWLILLGRIALAIEMTLENREEINRDTLWTHVRRNVLGSDEFGARVGSIIETPAVLVGIVYSNECELIR